MKHPPQRDPAPLSLHRNGGEGSLHIIREVWQFVRATGKWWLVPVLAALFLLGALAVLSGTGYAPFIYTLF